MTNRIYQVSKKGETNTRNIHYVVATSKKEAIGAASKIWPNINTAHDVSVKWRKALDEQQFPDYVIIAKDWL